MASFSNGFALPCTTFKLSRYADISAGSATKESRTVVTSAITSPRLVRRDFTWLRKAAIVTKRSNRSWGSVSSLRITVSFLMPTRLWGLLQKHPSARSAKARAKGLGKGATPGKNLVRANGEYGARGEGRL